MSLRPEAFGALLYHFGTRRLSFLKDGHLRDLVLHLGASPTVHAACLAAGIDDADVGRYERALRQLERSDMIREVLA